MDRWEKLIRKAEGKKVDDGIIRFPKEVTDYFPEIFDGFGNFRLDGPQMSATTERKFKILW